MSNTYERVKAVTAEILKVDPLRIEPTSRFVEDLGAESIQSVEIMAGLEDEFDIDIDEQEALQVKTVGEAAEFIDHLEAELA